MKKETLLTYLPENAENPKLIEIIKNIPTDILNNLEVSTADPETVLAYAGDDFQNLYILLDGSIKLSYELNTEFIYTFAVVNAVNIFGETEIFTEYPYYKSTLICATKCHYIVISKALFLTWVKKDNAALFCLASHIAGKYTEQVRQDRIFLSAAGEDRFIYLLAKYYKALNQKGICQINTPKEMLADEICVSNKTISRSIAKLKKEGLISTQGHNIIITTKQYEMLLEKYDYLFMVY